MMCGKQPVRVAVTGAAGQIGYSLLFRIASGAMLGPDQPVILQLLEIPQALPALSGVVMELEDCAFPLLHQVVYTDDARIAFRDADYVLLVGARPRSAGMERSDLLLANAAIFSTQGKVLNEVASREAKILVVGNPANTNAYIAMRNAPDIPAENFTAMMRLDHNRAVAQLAAKAGVTASAIRRVTIWGNHSATQCPDVRHTLIGGRPCAETVPDTDWLQGAFVTTVQQRGTEIIRARGASSAASAANAAIDHMRTWALGTEDGDWATMGILARGEYGYQNVIFGYPVTCQNGRYAVVNNLEVSPELQDRINMSYQELRAERDAVTRMV